VGPDSLIRLTPTPPPPRCFLYTVFFILIVIVSVQVLYATPDQDTFYDIIDALEEQDMGNIVKVCLKVE
jgi:hypothetical protein